VRAGTSSINRISVVRKVVLPLFLVSGAAGLIYEVTWTRAFGVVFGNTVFAVSTVLTAFMLGLAVGSYLFGRIADKSSRPLRLYAWLELGIGAYALVFAIVLAATDIFYRWFFRSFHPGFYPLSFVRFIISVIILLVPTALMGGTLPVLSRLWADTSKGDSGESAIGGSVGLLYAINTFGAVAGSFLAGYVLMRIIGVSGTIYLAASANIVIAILAFILSGLLGQQPVQKKRAKRGSEQAEGANVGQFGKKRLIVLVAVGLAGFCALAMEVLWTRVLVFVLGTSVYAFACMLTCYLSGIALGSFLCSQLLVGRIKNPIFSLGLVQLLVALSVVGSIFSLGQLWHIDYILMRMMFMGEFWKEVTGHFLDTFIVLLVPTVLMGMVFPIAVKICTESWKEVGKRVGEVYACNTVGCVLGSFAAGFVMVPLLGLRDSFLVIVSIQLFLAAAVIFLSEKAHAKFGTPAAIISLVVVIGCVLGIPRDIFLRTMNTYHHPSKIIYIKDDATGTVTVHDLPDGDRLIAVDGVDVAGVDLMLRTTQKLQGYIPLLVHGNPEKVLQIGFGSGETSGVGLGFGVQEYSIVEICPGVFEAGVYFEEINKGSYRDRRLRKIIMDGKNFVKLTDEKFDVIMNDSTYPGTTGSSALYTYDHFLQCREHLNPGGVLSCWVPLDLRPVDFQMIVKSFQAVMPHCSIWMANNCLNKHAVLLGTLSPIQIDFQRMKKLVERPDIASDLAQIKIYSVYDLLDCFVVGEDGLRAIAAEAPLNTDDKPHLEFGAAIKRDIEGCWIVILGWLSQRHCPVSKYIVNMGTTNQESQQVAATLNQYFEGTDHALRGLLGILQGDPAIMNSEFEMARKANPQDRDIDNCLEELRQEIEDLVGAIERTPGNAQLRSRLAKRYLLVQDYQRAAKQYRNFLSIEPDNAAAWNNLGICYNKLQQFDQAIWAFGRAIQHDATLVGAYLNLGWAYEKLDNFIEAARCYERVLPMTPRPLRISTLDRLARAYYMQKQYGLAIAALDEAIKLAPNDPVLRDYLHNRKQVVIQAAEGKQP